LGFTRVWPYSLNLQLVKISLTQPQFPVSMQLPLENKLKNKDKWLTVSPKLTWDRRKLEALTAKAG